MAASDEEIKADACYCVAMVLQAVSLHITSTYDDMDDPFRLWDAIYEIEDELLGRSGVRPTRHPKSPRISDVHVTVE